MGDDGAGAEKMPLERIQAAIAGTDDAAFRELYDTYSSDLRFGVRLYLAKVPRLRPDEEDIVAQGWVRLLARKRKQLRAYDPTKASFSHFMRMVGVNVAWQVADLKGHPSRWSSQAEVESMGASSDLETIIANRTLLEKAVRLLSKRLNDRERRLLEEVLICQRPADDVGKALGMSTPAVWTATKRLRRKVATIVEELQVSPNPSRSEAQSTSALLLLLVLVSVGVEKRGPDCVPAMNVPTCEGGGQ